MHVFLKDSQSDNASILCRSLDREKKSDQMKGKKLYFGLIKYCLVIANMKNC